MRRLAVIFGIGALWLFLFALPTLADNGPHMKGQFIGTTPATCANCHRAHSGQEAYLLRTPMPTLCYACHGSGGTGSALDVQDGVAYNDDARSGAILGALRGGGFDYALIDTTHVTAPANDGSFYGCTAPNCGTINTVGVLATGVSTTSHHSNDGSPVTMWGAGPYSATANVGTANVDLTCASCHDPHGNGQYRILRPTPNGAPSGAPAVKINDVAAGTQVYTTTNYGQIGTLASNDAQALNADGTGIEYTVSSNTYQGTFALASSTWCATCHTRYMGFHGSAGNSSFTANGTGDAIYDFKHATFTIVDPTNVGAPTSGVLTPITTGYGVKAGAVIGCWSSTTAAGTVTYYGVAVTLGTGSAGPSDCANNKDAVNASAVPDPTTQYPTLTTHAPRCVTCHVSHGSDAAMASNITSQTSPGDLVTGAVNLDSTLLRLDNRGVCEACHNK